MMTDEVWVALIGFGGTVIGAAIGAIATVAVAVARRQSGTKDKEAMEKVETAPVLGQSVDIRELRILRGLFGERNGRLLEAYHDRHYGPSLKAVIRKGWVKEIEGRYYMTGRGAEFCGAYLREVLSTWRPTDQLLA
jgi:hypothetical protein